MDNYKVYKLFPSPVFHYKINNFTKINLELKNYILGLRKSDGNGQKRSNFGGWHSPFFDLNHTTPKKFIKIIQEFLEKIITDEMGWEYDINKVKIIAMWSIINKKDSFNIKHNHPNSYLSAAYYVTIPKNSGNISFYDPKEQKNIRFPKIKKFTEMSATVSSMEPEEGDLLIFPSYLYHAVSTNLTNKDRIIISFNIDIEK